MRPLASFSSIEAQRMPTALCSATAATSTPGGIYHAYRGVSLPAGKDKRIAKFATSTHSAGSERGGTKASKGYEN